jgi:SAM-dependent methyltransferase
MPATLTRAEFATVQQLFEYKERGLPLKPFPGYSDDQWGIKAHNRPWIDVAGAFRRGERIVEVGGAYSLLPEYLAEKYGTESWIIDDFGGYSKETDLWQRWGNPDEWVRQHPTVKYVKKPMGFFDPEIPDNYFDCVFSVSTLEHIPEKLWPAVLKDMLRITKPGGRHLHAIDIPYNPVRRSLFWWLWSFVPGGSRLRAHPLDVWKRALQEAGVEFSAPWPGKGFAFDRSLLIESADVVFRFYPPCGKPKDFPIGGYSLLVEFRKTA